jgi:hypothetical protein
MRWHTDVAGSRVEARVMREGGQSKWGEAWNRERGYAEQEPTNGDFGRERSATDEWH